jgi:hypothetical protein
MMDRSARDSGLEETHQDPLVSAKLTVGLGLLLPPPTLIASAPRGGCHSRAPTTREVENQPPNKNHHERRRRGAAHLRRAQVGIPGIPDIPGKTSTNPAAPSALVLSHTYSSRPLSASHLLPLYLDHPTPRPNLIYLPNTNPPTLVFSLGHANLLFLLTTSSEVEPLLVLEFLHRAVDALEEFLGAPLLAHKIEANYDVVAQLLTEMCDAGTVSTTEPNALRDLVEVEGFMDKLLGNLNLPTYNPPPLSLPLRHTH